MANVKITQLPSATTPLTGTEVFPLVQGTTTKQVAITGLFTSPVMTNPTLGTVGQADLINATGLPISTGVAGLGTGIATFLGTPSSSNLRAAVTDETGTGSLVFATSPTLVTPNLGTPSVLVATNATGTAVGLTAGSAITNANLTGAVTSVGNATSLGSFTSAQLRTALTDETGAGVAVFATSPTITAPILNQINDTNNAQILGLSPTTSAVDYLVVKNGIGVGVPIHTYADGSSTNIGWHIQPKGTGLVTISDGTDFNKGIRFRSSGSAASAITLLDAVATAGRVVTLPDATTTLVGRDTTDTLTNKTIAFASNTFSGTLAITNGGTGQATANAALNALLPSQTGNATKYLQTDGSNSSWDAISLSTADITGTLGTANGGTGLTSFTSGGVVYASSTSALATGSALTFDGTNLGVGGTSSGKLTVFGGELIWGASSALGFLGYTGGFPLIGSVGALPLVFYTNSSERVRIDSSGRLLQGTTSPNAYVSNTTNAEWSTVFSKSNSSTSYDSIIGQVAIDNLDTTANNYSQLAFTTSDGANRVVTAGIYAQITARSSAAWSTSNLQFHTGTVGGPPTEKMRIASNGVVGVGITPSLWDGNVGLMDFRNSGGISSDSNYTYFSNNIYYDGTEKRKSSGYVGLFSIGKTGTPFVWSYAGTGAANSSVSFSEAMRIDGSGNLLVGGTSNAVGARFLSENASGNQLALRYTSVATYYNSVDSSGNLIWTKDGTERARIDSLGNLLVGTTTPNATTPGISLSGINGSATNVPFVQCSGAESTSAYASYVLYSTTASTYRFYVGYNGTISATSTTITAISDVRLKENIRDLDEGLATVMALKPRKFDWKAGKGQDIKNARGFIAQEFEAVLPDMIETWRDPAPEGEEAYKAINANLIPTLVKAIQEQQAIIESLKARLDAANL